MFASGVNWGSQRGPQTVVWSTQGEYTRIEVRYDRGALQKNKQFQWRIVQFANPAIPITRRRCTHGRQSQRCSPLGMCRERDSGRPCLPRKQAGHMTAPTNAAATSKKFSLIRRRPHPKRNFAALIRTNRFYETKGGKISRNSARALSCSPHFE
jgi:hypothetical protein